MENDQGQRTFRWLAIAAATWSEQFGSEDSFSPWVKQDHSCYFGSILHFDVSQVFGAFTLKLVNICSQASSYVRVAAEKGVVFGRKSNLWGFMSMKGGRGGRSALSCWRGHGPSTGACCARRGRPAPRTRPCSQCRAPGRPSAWSYVFSNSKFERILF